MKPTIFSMKTPEHRRDKRRIRQQHGAKRGDRSEQDHAVTPVGHKHQKKRASRSHVRKERRRSPHDLQRGQHFIRWTDGPQSSRLASKDLLQRSIGENLFRMSERMIMVPYFPRARCLG
jgi:hypothetical protein